MYFLSLVVIPSYHLYLFTSTGRIRNCLYIYAHVTPWHFVTHISTSLSFFPVVSLHVNTIPSHSLLFSLTCIYLSTHTNNASKVEADGLLVVVPVGFQRQTSVLGHVQMVGPVCVCVREREKRVCAVPTPIDTRTHPRYH